MCSFVSGKYFHFSQVVHDDTANNGIFHGYDMFSSHLSMYSTRGWNSLYVKIGTSLWNCSIVWILANQYLFQNTVFLHLFIRLNKNFSWCSKLSFFQNVLILNAVFAMLFAIILGSLNFLWSSIFNYFKIKHLCVFNVQFLYFKRSWKVILKFIVFINLYMRNALDLFCSNLITGWISAFSIYLLSFVYYSMDYLGHLVHSFIISLHYNLRLLLINNCVVTFCYLINVPFFGCIIMFFLDLLVFYYCTFLEKLN